MPIYEYRCEDCGSKFEKLVRRSSEDNVECPSCGTKHVKTELSVFAAHANGRARDAAPMPAGCPSGMCKNPGMCGMN